MRVLARAARSGPGVGLPPRAIPRRCAVAVALALRPARAQGESIGVEVAVSAVSASTTDLQAQARLGAAAPARDRLELNARDVRRRLADAEAAVVGSDTVPRLDDSRKAARGRGRSRRDDRPPDRIALEYSGIFLTSNGGADHEELATNEALASNASPALRAPDSRRSAAKSSARRRRRHDGRVHAPISDMVLRRKRGRTSQTSAVQLDEPRTAARCDADSIVGARPPRSLRLSLRRV